MRRIAIIPARGGSKRLPRKNVVEFLGRPIIQHTIIAALETGLFERVVVSTDDREIAGVAATAGAAVLERPADLGSDTARVVDVCLHALDAEAAAAREYDVMCCLYATSPLRGADDIAAVVGMVGDRCDFAMAVTQYDYPPWQALRPDADGGLRPVWPDLIKLRSQEIGELLVDNGSTYAVSVPAFRQTGSFYGDGLRGHIMPRERSIDIDLAVDLEMARFFAGQIA